MRHEFLNEPVQAKRWCVPNNEWLTWTHSPARAKLKLAAATVLSKTNWVSDDKEYNGVAKIQTIGQSSNFTHLLFDSVFSLLPQKYCLYWAGEDNEKKWSLWQKSLKTCLYFLEDLELAPCLMPEANQISGGWVCTQTKQGDRGGTDMYPGQRQGLSGVWLSVSRLPATSRPHHTELHAPAPTLVTIHVTQIPIQTQT